MRKKPERNPSRAAVKGLREENIECLMGYMRECFTIAVMLDQDSQEALDRAIPRGREALESAFLEMKKRAAFARFFATEAQQHRVCPSRVCQRARHCAGLSLSCTRGRVLDRDEETYARGRLSAFIRIMSAPETEEEQRLNGKTPSDIRASGAKPFSASRNARESHRTRGLSQANQIQ